MQSLSLLKYDTPGTVEIANNGRTLIITGFDKWKNQPLMRGTGLDYTYRLEQIHFHWGYDRASGSEHTLNGRYYSAEIHLVHVREGMSLAEASEFKDGLAVLGIWMTEGENEKNFAQINERSESVQFEGDHAKLNKFQLKRLLPKRTTSFFRYEGSLTTPSCSEIVRWTMLAEPLEISTKQFDRLRALTDKQGVSISGNNRPVQSLNGRRIIYRPQKNCGHSPSLSSKSEEIDG
ncbi:hypothetical protein WR25_19462 [Diploscapter pachys]|uniref:Carbonic anhydrase n=1 Tax=Diploscapter pachys TaxID=2018661 RepID=A0A2A2KLC3_9BILA|nr:hypothetical protein WR25_19462 [Diploscapter pachys]